MVSSQASAQVEKGWKIEKIGGRDYLPLSQVQEFYRLERRDANDGKILLESGRIALTFEADTTGCTINGIKFVLHQDVKIFDNEPHLSREDLAHILDPVFRPRFIRNAGTFNTVILDAAHGGRSPGLINAHGTEAEFTLQVALKAKTLLENKGFEIVMTRNEDQHLLLQERVAAANGIEQEAVFVSISFDSGPKKERGIETLPLSRGAEGMGEFHPASMALATSIHGNLIRRLGKNTRDRGINQVRHSILSSVKHPAILVEGGFMTHEYEARLIANDSYQSALAQAITDGILKYRLAVTAHPAEADDKEQELPEEAE